MAPPFSFWLTVFWLHPGCAHLGLDRANYHGQQGDADDAEHHQLKMFFF